MRHCVTSKFKDTVENDILGYIRMPRDRHTASQFYKLVNYNLSGESANIKLLWQRDLKLEYTNEKWLDILSESGKYVKEARSKFIQYKVLHRYYHTPTRLHRMKLMPDNLCWKCKTEVGTYLHCLWECSLVTPFWTKVLGVLSAWSGSEVPQTPELCLLGDRSQMPNVTKGAFSVIMVGLVTASRIILRHWKTTVCPELNDWIKSMADTASYESMLNNLKGDRDTDWDSFWNSLKHD